MYGIGSLIVSAFVLGIPSEGHVKCSYIEKEKIPTVWTVSMIFVIKGLILHYQLFKVTKVTSRIVVLYCS